MMNDCLKARNACSSATVARSVRDVLTMITKKASQELALLD